MASGCSDCSSSARSPPANMDASPCTRRIGRSSANQRGPGAAKRSRLAGPFGPATRAKSAPAIRCRNASSRGATRPRAGPGRALASARIPRLCGHVHLSACGQLLIRLTGRTVPPIPGSRGAGGRSTHPFAALLLIFISRGPGSSRSATTSVRPPAGRARRGRLSALPPRVFAMASGVLIRFTGGGLRLWSIASHRGWTGCRPRAGCCPTAGATTAPSRGGPTRSAGSPAPRTPPR